MRYWCERYYPMRTHPLAQLVRIVIVFRQLISPIYYHRSQCTMCAYTLITNGVLAPDTWPMASRFPRSVRVLAPSLRSLILIIPSARTENLMRSFWGESTSHTSSTAFCG